MVKKGEREKSRFRMEVRTGKDWDSIRMGMRTVTGQEKTGGNSTGLGAGTGQETEGWSKGGGPGW